MEEIEGYVENIVFRNEENGYTVLHLSHPEWDDDICCVGCFSYVAEGQYLVVRGDMVFHKEYGEQMKVTSYEEKHDKATFVKNIISDNILLGDIYTQAKELHFVSEVPRAAFLVRQLGQAAEVYVTAQLERSFRTLDYYKSILPQEEPTYD